MRLPSVVTLLILLLAGCGSGFDADDYSTEVAAARFEILRPALEKVLGEPYGPPPAFRAATREERIERLAGWVRNSRGEIWGGPRGEDLEKFANQVASVRAELLPLTVDLEAGEILIEPAAFEALSELCESPDLALSPGFFDVSILKQAILLRDHRTVGLDGFLGGQVSEFGYLCREAVAAGHSEYVIRRVADEVSLQPEHQLARDLCARPPAAWAELPDAAFRGQVLTELGHAIMQGERFVDALAVKIGYPAARDLIYAHPPASIDDLSNGDTYADRRHRTTLAEIRGEKFAAVFDGERFETSRWPLDRATLIQACAVAGEELLTEGAAGVVDALILTGVEGEGAASNIRVVIVECSGEGAAEAYRRLNRAVLVEKDRRLTEAGGRVTLVSTDYSDSGREDLPGTWVDRVLTLGEEGEARPYRTLLVQGGAVVLEITSDGGGESREQLAALADRVLKAVKRPE